jgi:putative FmdB family regulatory protein
LIFNFLKDKSNYGEAMPIYEYTCKSCEARFEQLQRSMTPAEHVKCAECGSKRTARALSVFAVGAEGAKSSPSAPPGMCGRCGGPGPCPSEF